MSGAEYRVMRDVDDRTKDVVWWRRNNQAVWVQVAVVDHDDYRAASDGMVEHRDHRGGGL